MGTPTNARVAVVVGPTATGKTAVGVALAQALAGEVISADSQLVYQGLDIGTAKPTKAEQQGIPHHMLDRVLPNESYSAGRYQQEANVVLNEILSRGKTPIVVGGTGFYLRGLLESTDLFPNVRPDEMFRSEMHTLADAEGNEALYRRLQAQDPDRADMLHPNDRFRLIRALEIIHQTGRPVPKNPTPRTDLDITWIGLTYEDRDAHRAIIDQRIEAMRAAGWLAEVQTLLQAYGSEAEALQVAHGYPEWVQFLQGSLSEEAALAKIQINIHQYARRQRTWFRRNPKIHWIFRDGMSDAAVCAAALQHGSALIS